MPVEGYTRLKELEIIQDFEKEINLVRSRSNRGCASLWDYPAALLRSQVNGPLSSVETTDEDATSDEFWEALAECRGLKSLRLENIYCPVGCAGYSFWKDCRSLETLTLVS